LKLPNAIRYQPTGKLKAWVTGDAFLKADGVFPAPASSSTSRL
jgi:hypothetical protein